MPLLTFPFLQAHHFINDNDDTQKSYINAIAKYKLFQICGMKGLFDSTFGNDVLYYSIYFHKMFLQ